MTGNFDKAVADLCKETGMAEEPPKPQMQGRRIVISPRIRKACELGDSVKGNEWIDKILAEARLHNLQDVLKALEDFEKEPKEGIRCLPAVLKSRIERLPPRTDKAATATKAEPRCDWSDPHCNWESCVESHCVNCLGKDEGCKAGVKVPPNWEIGNMHQPEKCKHFQKAGESATPPAGS